MKLILVSTVLVSRAFRPSCVVTIQIGLQASAHVSVQSIDQKFLLKEINVPQVNLRLPQVKSHIISFPGCIRDIENTRLRFESEAGARAEKLVVNTLAIGFIGCPTCIDKRKEEGIKSYQVPVLHGSNGICGSVYAFLVKTS